MPRVPPVTTATLSFNSLMRLASFKHEISLAPLGERVARQRRVRGWIRLLTAARGAEVCLDLLEIRLRVDADGIVCRFDHGDRDAVLEKSQLLQSLRDFEFRGRERMEPAERFGRVGVDPEVLVIARAARAVAVVGNGRAVEIKRAAREV